MTAAELSARLATGIGPLPDRPIVLTFDDGYADFHSRAMPLLDRHGFAATLFVTTGWEQDAGLRRSAPGRMLDRTQLAEAAAAGWRSRLTPAATRSSISCPSTREAGYRYAHAVDNATASQRADPFAVPRLTVRRAPRCRSSVGWSTAARPSGCLKTAR
jgi:hypothetical protein